MLTAVDVAMQLAISARKVYELAASGQMACHRFGGAVRFSQDDVDAYVQAARHPVAPQDRSTVRLTTVSLRPSGHSALDEYFKKRGLRPKRKPPSPAA
jgi:excisionase family DNA binding protein